MQLHQWASHHISTLAVQTWQPHLDVSMNNDGDVSVQVQQPAGSIHRHLQPQTDAEHRRAVGVACRRAQHVKQRALGAPLCSSKWSCTRGLAAVRLAELQTLPAAISGQPHAAPAWAASLPCKAAAAVPVTMQGGVRQMPMKDTCRFVK